MPLPLRILAVVLLLAGACRAAEPRQAKGISVWTGKDVAKVVEYRFQGPDDDPLSLVSEAGVELKKLRRFTRKSATLSAAQVSTLLDATFNKKHRTVTAACYDPHHIFVFYAKNGRVLRAIELCFECTTVVTTPALTDEQQNHHDFTALARLTDELGLWSGGTTVDQFAAMMKEREPAPE